MTLPFRIANPVAWQDLGSQTVPLATQPFVPVVERCDVYKGTDGTNSTAQWVTTAGRFGRTVHRVNNPGATQLQFRYSNWVSMPAGSGGGEVANSNSITVRASVEYPAGVYRIISGSTAYASGTTYAVGDQVTSGGAAYVSLADSNTGHSPASNPTWWQLAIRYLIGFMGMDANRVVTLATNADALSLPVSLSTALADNARVAVNTMMISGSATNKIPPCDNIGSWDFTIDYATTGAVPAPAADLVDTWPTTQTPMAIATGSTSFPGSAIDPTWDAATNKTPCPVIITGNSPATRYTAVIGDSLPAAYNDSFVDGWQHGFAGRAYAQQGMAHWRITQGGDRLQWLQSSNAAKRIALAQQAPSILCVLGGNDVSNSRTLAQMQADAQTCWTALATGGARVFASTVFPQSTSTDSWATVANQTARFGVGSVRDTYNAWLRAGASMTVDGQTVTVGQLGHPLAGILDVSSAFEAPTDSTKILTNGSANYATQDGAHPSAAANVLIAAAMAPSVPRMLDFKSTIHATTHSSNGTDPLTLAQLQGIGAADALTLGGWLPGGVLSFVSAMEGQAYSTKLSSCDTTAVTSTYAPGTSTLMVYLGTAFAGVQYSRLRWYLTVQNTALVTVGLYIGTSQTSLASAASGTLAANSGAGLKTVTFGSAYTTTAVNFVALVFTAASAALGTFQASPAGLSAIINRGTATGSALIRVGTGAGTSQPGTINVQSGFTGAAQVPWVELS